MSTATTTRSKRRQALTIVLLFLIADLLVADAIPRYELQPDNAIFHVQLTDNATADSQIYSIDSTTNYGGDVTANIGPDDVGVGESKMVISFPLNLSGPTDISSASVELLCATDLSAKTSTFFISALSDSFNESAVSWMNRTATQLWAGPGADGVGDHGEWEPPSVEMMNGTFSFNVTALVQKAVRNGNSSINFLIAAFGAQYSCSTMDETSASDRPKILITYAVTAPAVVGTLQPNFITDGAALMTGDFILSANTLPTISWANQLGQGAEVQLSLSDSFMDTGDSWWSYSSMNNGTFQFSATNGQMTFPSENELSNGTTMNYRIRASNSDQIGDWETGYFHLPSLLMTDNGNGTASVSIFTDTLGLTENAIKDTYSDDSVSGGNQNFGGESEVVVGMDTPMDDQYGYFGINPILWGMHSNATMLQADFVLTRSSYNNDGRVSFHRFDNNDWSEGGLTSNSPGGSIAWSDGGRNNKDIAAIQTFWSNQSGSELRIDISTEVQEWLDTSSIDPISIFSTIRGEYEQHVASTDINFHSTEATSQSDQPYLELMYKWGDGVAPYSVDLLAPEDGTGVWSVNQHNLSGNTTPTLEWNGSDASAEGYEMIWQLSSGPEFRNITASVNTIDDSDFAPSDGSFNLSSLIIGNTYAWRMQHIASDGHRGPWSSSTFFIPGITSTWLGGDSYELRLSSGNSSSSAPAMPNCQDTYIDSGSPNSTYGSEGEIQVSYSSFSEASILFGCDMSSHFLPDGYAVSYANLRMKLSYVQGNPVVGAWDNSQSNWDADSATWNTYDGVNNWSQSGAKGSERGSLLSSSTITSAFSSGDWVSWNVTLGTQDAMRNDGSLDFIVGMIGAGTGGSREALLYSSEEPALSRPEIVLVYTPGSDAIPNNPVPISPANASWSIESGIEPAPEVRPVLEWSYGIGVVVGGWSIEIDTVDTFDGADLSSFASWNDNGFDSTNLTYTPQADFAEGFVWYWRVRAVSTTNQLGNWSSTFNFLLPDITTWLLDANTSAVEYHHHEALPSLQIPEFEDTWVADSGTSSSSTHGTDTVLKVGTESDGSRVSALLRIPLNALPNPANAHISMATLNLYPEWGSSPDQHISIHPSLKAWNNSANGTTYDGVNTWSRNGGLGATDSGPMSDVHAITHASWAQFEITELVQDATLAGSTHLSLMIIGDDATGLVSFSSVDSSSNRPWLNLTWSAGNASSVTVHGTPNSPLSGAILWDNTSHALLPAGSPTLIWNHPSPSSVDDWRIYFWNNASNEREGWTIHDTRVSLSGFDIASLSWTPPSDQNAGKTYRWFVQPIIDDIYGPRSSPLHYHLPAAMSGELNSTDAWLNVVEGAMVTDIAYPNVMTDTWLNQGAQTINYGGADKFTIGASPSSTTLRANAVLEVDVSSLPIPGPYDVVDAKLKLYRNGGQNAVIMVSVCDLYVPFDESNTTWNQASNTTSWQVGGAGGSLDASVPIDVVDITGGGWFTWDITQLVQAALVRGDETVRLLIRAEGAGVNSYHTFASSENLDVNIRPQLNLTIRSTAPWLPQAATGLDPLTGQTMWNMSAVLPSPMEEIAFTWNSVETNVSGWHFQGTSEPRFLILEADAWSNNSNTWENGTFNVSSPSKTFTIGTDDMGIDQWLFWRVRSVQDYRISNWSSINLFRMPDYEGEDDGTGNLTLNLNRGSVFVNTTILPSVPDNTIDSSSASTNLGSAITLFLGIGATGGGESRILIEFDLNEIPFPANMTPTSTLLSMYRAGISGGQSLTVAAYPCASFSESGSTWNNAPTCSTTEITRTTLGTVPATGYVEWDVTSLAQSNIAAGNRTLTIMLAVLGTPGATHTFRSSEYTDSEQRPSLVFGYVDNSAGVIPPAQPTLLYPADGEVIYDESDWILQPSAQPTLQWNAVTNATDYILTLANLTSQTKYRSWEDAGFNGVNYTPTLALAAGESYEWWVQAINGSIPGPSSSRWNFAIGNPVNNTYNFDNTYTYQIRHGEEVPSIGHANMVDSVIDAGAADSAIEDSDLMVGTDSNGDEKRSIIVLDPTQFPLPTTAQVHSASIGLYVENTIMNAGVASSWVTISAHPLLTGGYTSLGTTWNEVSNGNLWGAPGMQAGVDYGSATGNVTIMASVSFEGWVWLDLSHSGLDLTSIHEFVLIVTGPAYLDIAHSQDTDISHRPVILVNYTHVDQVTISPASGASTDADNTIQYSYIMYDPNGSVVSGAVEWSSTSGSINSDGLFTPDISGNWVVKACFGLVCDSVTVTVTPGAPVTWNSIFVTDSGSLTIDADQGVFFEVTVYDQHANIVQGEVVTSSVTNGTLTEQSTSDTHAWRWDAWAVGSAQIIEINWGTQTEYKIFTVIPGSPVSITIGNCGDDDLYVPAGTTCSFTWEVVDSKGNDVNKSVLGLVTWDVESPGGNITAGNFTADIIGTWQVNLTSAFGLDENTTVTVVHGAIDYLEINASATTITADDRIWLNTTRVDVRGNRMVVDLPAENWTVGSGWLTPGTEGSPAIWEPETVGAKMIRGSYNGSQTEVIIAVSHGVIRLMEIDMNTPTNLTADDQSSVSSYGVDAKGNRWSVEVDWMISKDGIPDAMNIKDWLYGYDVNDAASGVIFKPTFTGLYTVQAIYTESGSVLNFTVSVNYTITHGQLSGISFIFPGDCNAGAEADSHWASDCIWEMDTDEVIPFKVELVDFNDNPIDNDILTWTMDNEDITATMFTDDFVWSGETRDEGLYVIRASDSNGLLSDQITVNISHGRALVVAHEASANSVEAGQKLTVRMTGTDVAGNTFAQDVEWVHPTETLVKTGIGIYSYTAAKEGPYDLAYELPGAQGGTWSITVAHSALSEIIIVIDTTAVEQQETVTISLTAFDDYGNPVAVPTGSALVVEATGRGEVTEVNSTTFAVETLDEGEHTISVSTVISGQIVSNSVIYNVSATIPGFFASGGPLYYVAGGLGAFVIVVLLVLVIVLFRRSTEGYDEEDWEEDDEEDGEVRKSDPEIPELESATESTQSTDGDDSYRVDDDGTEWWEDEHGIWWFKEPGDEDWQEWSE